MSSYDIVVTGQVREGFERAEVQQRLATLFKCPPEKAQQLLSGKPVSVKKGVDRTTAERYGRSLHDAGVSVQIKPTRPAVSSEKRQERTPDALPQMTCPKCGTSQPKADNCAQCGILVAKFRADGTSKDKAPVQSPPEEDTSETSQIDEMEAFVGENYGAYRELFQKLFHTGHKYDFRWSWPAFLIALPWMLYRKMFLYAVIFIVLAVLPIPGLGLVMALLMGALGQSLYYHHCNKKIAAIEESGADRIRVIRASGGTLSVPLTIVATILIGLCISTLYTKLFFGDQLETLVAQSESSPNVYSSGAEGQTQAKMIMLAQTIKMAKMATEMQGGNYSPPSSMADLRAQLNFDQKAVQDIWGTEMRLLSNENGSLQLISAGIDREFGTDDDLYQPVPL